MLKNSIQMIGTNWCFQNKSPWREGRVVMKAAFQWQAPPTIQGYASFFTNSFISTQQFLCFSSFSTFIPTSLPCWLMGFLWLGTCPSFCLWVRSHLGSQPFLSLSYYLYHMLSLHYAVSYSAMCGYFSLLKIISISTCGCTQRRAEKHFLVMYRFYMDRIRGKRTERLPEPGAVMFFKTTITVA